MFANLTMSLLVIIVVVTKLLILAATHPTGENISVDFEPRHFPGGIDHQDPVCC